MLQHRPKLFERNIHLPELLYERVGEVAERVGARGEIIRDLNLDSAREHLQAAYDAGGEPPGPPWHTGRYRSERGCNRGCDSKINVQQGGVLLVLITPVITIVAAGIRSTAIVFMHGYRYADHELAVARLAKDIGFTQVIYHLLLGLNTAIKPLIFCHSTQRALGVASPPARTPT
eukprot:1181064-Prorocentrum_minimum.AAC.1